MSTAISIRELAVNMFGSLLDKRIQMGNLAFRKKIILDLVEQTGCTIAAASTHYNYAFQKAKIEVPEKVVGLGRPEGKNNGGRKKKVATPVGQPQPKHFQPSGTLLLTYTPNLDALLQPALLPPLPEEKPAPQLVTVIRAKDGLVVAEGIPEQEANAMIETAAKRKKAKLAIKQ